MGRGCPGRAFWAVCFGAGPCELAGKDELCLSLGQSTSQAGKIVPARLLTAGQKRKKLANVRLKQAGHQSAPKL